MAHWLTPLACDKKSLVAGFYILLRVGEAAHVIVLCHLHFLSGA